MSEHNLQVFRYLQRRSQPDGFCAWGERKDIDDSTTAKADSTTESLSDGTDSREKLEADVRDICWGRNIYRFDAQKRYLKEHGLDVRENIVTTNYEGHVLANVIMHLLDRQAAITRRETLLENPLHNNPYVGLVRGKQWERKESSDYYCGKCGWKVTDHDSYCPECGGALHRVPKNAEMDKCIVNSSSGRIDRDAKYAITLKQEEF